MGIFFLQRVNYKRCRIDFSGLIYLILCLIPVELSNNQTSSDVLLVKDLFMLYARKDFTVQFFPVTLRRVFLL